MRYKKFISLIIAFTLMFSIITPMSTFGLFPNPDQVNPDISDQNLVWAMNSLRGVASFIKFNAHPDDENNTAMAAYHLRDAIYPYSLQITRGAGGQNALGPEQGHPYNTVRTMELTNAQESIYGQARFTNYGDDWSEGSDFGNSRQWEEALINFWDADRIVERIVKEIRTIRPDFTQPQGSLSRTDHGHHQAVNMLSYAAAILAADPTVFPHHFDEGLKPWAIPFFHDTRHGDIGFAVFPDDFMGGYFKGYSMANQPGQNAPDGGSFQVWSGTYHSPQLNAISGTWYSSASYGSYGRGFHISQGMSSSFAAGSASNSASSLNILKPSGVRAYAEAIGQPIPNTAISLWDSEWGVPKDLGSLATYRGGTGSSMINAAFLDLQRQVDEMWALLPVNNTFSGNFGVKTGDIPYAEILGRAHAMIDDVTVLIDAIAASNNIKKFDAVGNDVKYDLIFRLERKLSELNEVSRQASRASMLLKPSTWTPYAGQTFEFPVVVTNLGGVALDVTDVKLNMPSNTDDWVITGNPAKGILAPGATATYSFNVYIPADSILYDPYTPSALDSQPTATVTYEINGVAASAHVRIPRQPNWEGLYDRFMVMPQYSIAFDPQQYVVNINKNKSSLPLDIIVESYMIDDNQNPEVTLDLPYGWTASPQSVPLSFTGVGQERTASFTIYPPAEFGEERVFIGASVIRNGIASKVCVQKIGEYSEFIRSADGRPISENGIYRHIGPQRRLTPSELLVQGIDIHIPQGLKVGFIDGLNDTVGPHLELAGFDVTYITRDDMYNDDFDLNVFDSIYINHRAAIARRDITMNQRGQRLLDYVFDGGNLIMNYHQSGDSGVSGNTLTPNLPAPSRMDIGSSRAVRTMEENAPVKHLVPDHPIFNFPHVIEENGPDYDGWYQERSIYNLAMWAIPDNQFIGLLESNDWGTGIGPQTGDDNFGAPNPQTGILAWQPYGAGNYTYSGLVWHRQIVQGVVPGAYRLLTNLLCLGFDYVEPVTDHLVSFYALDGETLIHQQTVVDGGFIDGSIPELYNSWCTPELLTENYLLPADWTAVRDMLLDLDTDEEFNWKATPITKDMKVTIAVIKPIPSDHLVSFYALDGETLVHQQTVEDGGFIDGSIHELYNSWCTPELLAVNYKLPADWTAVSNVLLDLDTDEEFNWKATPITKDRKVTIAVIKP